MVWFSYESSEAKYGRRLETTSNGEASLLLQIAMLNHNVYLKFLPYGAFPRLLTTSYWKYCVFFLLWKWHSWHGFKWHSSELVFIVPYSEAGKALLPKLGTCKFFELNIECRELDKKHACILDPIELPPAVMLLNCPLRWPSEGPVRMSKQRQSVNSITSLVCKGLSLSRVGQASLSENSSFR
jgi:hypothetical protein